MTIVEIKQKKLPVLARADTTRGPVTIYHNEGGDGSLVLVHDLLTDKVTMQQTAAWGAEIRRYGMQLDTQLTRLLNE